ncbi:MAG TPA: hypothetical protein DEO40_03995 [Treponema sp.]|nr:hypothetical protein [Treponema sp.]
MEALPPALEMVRLLVRLLVPAPLPKVVLSNPVQAVELLEAGQALYLLEIIRAVPLLDLEILPVEILRETAVKAVTLQEHKNHLPAVIQQAVREEALMIMRHRDRTH